MPVKPSDFCRELRLVSVQIMSMYDRVIPGTIILYYLDAPLLEVDTDRDHWARVEDFFFVLFPLF